MNRAASTLALLGLLSLGGCARYPLQRLPADATVSSDGDHGPHRDAQTEWWHLHATLRDMSSHEPLHLFAAFVVERTDLDRVAGLPVSLAVNPMHTAYVKVVTRGESWSADRYNFPDLFTARFVGEGLDLRHGGWRLAWEAGAAIFKGGAGRHHLELRFDPQGQLLRPGDQGRVEIPPGSPHLWTQSEGMHVEGRWQDGRQTRWVEGSGFYKHQWGRLYDDRLDGFQWFSMDLSDEQSLVVAWLLDDTMSGVPGSMAWVSDRAGNMVEMPIAQMRVTPTRRWKSPRSGAQWPVAWNITGSGLDLQVESTLDDQEMWIFPAPIYTGPARATGQFMGQDVDVDAFVEQVGASMPKFRFLFQSRAPG